MKKIETATDYTSNVMRIIDDTRTEVTMHRLGQDRIVRVHFSPRRNDFVIGIFNSFDKFTVGASTLAVGPK